MKYEVIRSQDQWHALRSQWNTLLVESRANQLFMTWEWLDCWLRVQRSVTDLRIICVRGTGGELLGVAPFYVANYRLLDILPYRMLRMIGDVDSGAEYQTWLARKSDEDRVCEVIVRAMRALRSEWDLLWIPNLVSYTVARARYSALGLGENPYGDPKRPGHWLTAAIGILFAAVVPGILLVQLMFR